MSLFSSFLPLTLILAISIVHAQQPPQAVDLAKIQAEIETFQKQQPFSGMIGVYRAGKQVLLHRSGFADYSKKKPFSEDLVFPIASISKQFTAAAAMLLVESGQLKLNDTLIRHLPSSHPLWKGAQPPKWASQITLHHLLSHSSGLPEFTQENWDQLGELTDSEIYPQLFQVLRKRKLDFRPGERMKYSNTGFLLLSLILDEKTPQKSLVQFIHNKIIIPLGLTKTYLPEFSEERQLIKTFNQDDRFPMRYVQNFDDPSAQAEIIQGGFIKIPLRGAGAMRSSVNDLAKYAHALYDGEILTPHSRELMKKAYFQTYHTVFGKMGVGYGVLSMKIKSGIMYRHPGRLKGNRADLSYNPQTGIVIVMISNISPSEKLPLEIRNRYDQRAYDFMIHLHEILQ